MRYHARDMAILRAHRAGGVCVLGSATPSLESEQLARTRQGARSSCCPSARARRRCPTVEIVDLRRIGAGPDRRQAHLSCRSTARSRQTLAAKEQTILFLNRRGFAPSVRCEACGELATCPHCSVALTFHKQRAAASCAATTATTRRRCPTRCPECGARPRSRSRGSAPRSSRRRSPTAFPEARVARLDRDVASGEQVEKILERVRAREVDILVGTQMVTKGHDLPDVTLVGVINADAALSIPDFRAAERTFQLLVQVAGRAGRGDAPGRVLVQTLRAGAPRDRVRGAHDVDGFLERELARSQELGYPPFSRMVARARRRARRGGGAGRRGACSRARPRAAARDGGGRRVDGARARAAPIARVRNRFRFRVMLRSSSRERLRQGALAIHVAIGDAARARCASRSTSTRSGRYRLAESPRP